jgi:hypothetical protein
MASLETISQELKKRKVAVNLARSVSDFACKSKADKETLDFLWNKYNSLQQSYGVLALILEQVGSATIELQKAAEWRSQGIYHAHVLEAMKLSRPDWSQRALAALHQEMIDKATEQQNAAMAELTRLLEKAEAHLSG